jgi:8-oxo-dGTP pyrophosphatase MutT (NUDIX family)
MEPILRPASRVVIIDQERRVLLVRFYDADRSKTWWATPGGSLEPGETHEAAATREIREETGLDLIDLGPWIWTREHVVSISGQLYRQQEHLYLASVQHFDPVGTHLEEVERDRFQELRWWSLDELASTPDELSPRDLPDLVRQLLRDGPPPAPVAVGV